MGATMLLSATSSGVGVNVRLVGYGLSISRYQGIYNPSGGQVVKAFTAEDFAFLNKSWCHLSTVNDSSFEVANTVQITWRIQKYCQNAQTITMSSNSAHPDLCPLEVH
jgi:hypothetical protein